MEEKRIFLAVSLSLLVLLTYNSIISKSANKNRKEHLGNSVASLQPIDNNKDADLSVAPPTLPVSGSAAISTAEVSQLIENDNFTAEFSNIGGSLKSLTLKKFQHRLPLTGILALRKFDNVPFVPGQIDSKKVTYVFADAEQRITKIYDFSNINNTIGLSIEIKNTSPDARIELPAITSFIIDTKSANKDKNHLTERTLFEYSAYLADDIFRKNNAYKFSPKDALQKSGPIHWVGFRNRYFCFIVKPEFQAQEFGANYVDPEALDVFITPASYELKPGGAVVYKFLAYAGPQDVKILKAYKQKFEDIISFSGFGIVDVISKTILHAISFLHRYLRNWGLCIIVVSAMIYGMLYPLTLNSVKSMRRMQLLQPEMAKLREKYKSNPQKLNQELMELYKIHKVNPFGGCLPLFFQMPVFIGLYQALWRSVYFNGASFLWIKDLSQPDRLFILPWYLPAIGNEVNILPIIMMVLVYFQQKISSKGVLAATPEQAAQQRIMGIFFPIFLGFVFYHFASGLALYFTVFYSLSNLTQLKMSKMKLA